MSSDTVYDCVIVGAGVIGCSIARELARYNFNLILIDQGNDVSTGASKANSGIIHGGYDERHGTLKARVSHVGNQLFGQLQRHLNFGFRRIGSMVCAFNQQDMKTIEDLLENGQKNGVKGLRLLERDEVLAKEPHISQRVCGALFCPHTGITSPYEYCIALAENAAMNGVKFLLNHRVVTFGQHDGCIHVHCVQLPSQTPTLFKAKIVINCAGLGADEVAFQFEGHHPFRIIPRKGEYLILDKKQNDLAHHVLFPAPDPVLGKGILVSPTYWNNLLLGPTSRSLTEHVENDEVIKQLIEGGLMLIPSLDVRHTITSYAGLRAKCSTRDFIIDWSTAGHMLHCAGIDSPGLTSSPAVGRIVLDMVLKRCHDHPGFIPETNWTKKAPHVFIERRPAIIQIKSEEYLSQCSDDHADPRYRIVCSCEKITEAEVMDAVTRPPVLPQQTLATVKRRTRCGMGVCQGTFCGPRLQQLLADYFHVPEQAIRGPEQGTSLLPNRRVGTAEKEHLERLLRSSKKSNL